MNRKEHMTNGDCVQAAINGPFKDADECNCNERDCPTCAARDRQEGEALGALRQLMPYVLEDYMPDFATPAFAAAVERARKAAK